MVRRFRRFHPSQRLPGTCCTRLSPFSIRARSLACFLDSPSCLASCGVPLASRGALDPKTPGRTIARIGRKVARILYSPRPGICEVLSVTSVGNNQGAIGAARESWTYKEPQPPCAVTEDSARSDAKPGANQAIPSARTQIGGPLHDRTLLPTPQGRTSR
jgi:hypothetical protein